MIVEKPFSLIDLYVEFAPKVKPFTIPRVMTLSELKAYVEAYRAQKEAPDREGRF